MSDTKCCENCPAHIDAADEVLHKLIKERQKGETKMKTIFDYIAIVGAYCCNCIFQPYCHVDRIRCDGRIMTDIGIDMILRGEY